MAHQEYPKLIYLDPKNYIVVNSIDEEQIARKQIADSEAEVAGEKEEKPRRGRPPKAKE